MTVRCSTTCVRLSLASGAFVVVACLMAAQPEPEPSKKSAEPEKSDSKMPSLLRLFDGGFQLPPPAATTRPPERVLISPLELQKLHDQIESLKKEAANRKPVPPSGCAIRVRIETRGETTIAVVRLSYTFRTTMPNAVVSLGGKKGFLIAAHLDGRRGLFGAAIDASLGTRSVPVLEAAEDGYTIAVEAAGSHTLTLDLEAPVSARGAKSEIGFDLALPRAAITSLLLDAPNNIRRVNLALRTPDLSQPAKPAEVRRVSALDVKQLTPRPDALLGYPLGPIDSLELTWDPPSGSGQNAEAVSSVEWEVLCKLSDRNIETDSKARLHGNVRTWRIALPKGTELTASRSARDPGIEVGPLQLPTITPPADPNSRVWAIEIPAGTTASDWVLTATQRLDREKLPDPAKPQPISIGPFSALGVSRQTGTIRVTASGSVRFEFDAAPDLHRSPVPEPADGATSELFFRFASGPSNTVGPGPMLQVKMFPIAGAVRVKPTYRLHLTPNAWQIEADLLVTPVRTEIESLTVEIPTTWRSLVADPVELVEGLLQDDVGDGLRRTATIKLAGAQRRPFELKLRANVSTADGTSESILAMPRFPAVTSHDAKLEVTERDAVVSVVVGAEWAIRGTAREWEDAQPASWDVPLPPSLSAEGKAGRALSGRFEHGVARLDLTWRSRRSEVLAQSRVELMVERRQVRVSQTIRFQGAMPAGHPIRLRGSTAAVGLKADPPVRPTSAGEWQVEDGADFRDGVIKLEYALPIPKSNADDVGPWTVPISLISPIDIGRLETTVRIWTATTGVRLDEIHSAGWRDLPPESSADRPALPAATLLAIGSNTPLSLQLRPALHARETSAWVTRGLIRAQLHDVGPIEFESRFQIHRWVADSLDVRVPAPSTGEEPEVLLDGISVEAAIVPDAHDPGFMILRVPLPETRTQHVELEVKYQLKSDRGMRVVLLPPELLGVEYEGPIRWLVRMPAGRVGISTVGTAEQFWSLRTGLFRPLSRSEDALEEWFRTGQDSSLGFSEDVGDYSFRQSSPGAISMFVVSRSVLVILCSVGVFLLFWGLTRLRGSIVGPLIAVLGGGLAAAAVGLPQAAAQVATAAEPGLAVLVLFLTFRTVMRWYTRHRVTHLPGFTRTHAGPPAGPSTANQPVAAQPPLNGSTGSNGVPLGSQQPVSTGSAVNI